MQGPHACVHMYVQRVLACTFLCQYVGAVCPPMRLRSRRSSMLVFMCVYACCFACMLRGSEEVVLSEKQQVHLIVTHVQKHVVQKNLMF